MTLRSTLDPNPSEGSSAPPVGWRASPDLGRLGLASGTTLASGAPVTPTNRSRSILLTITSLRLVVVGLASPGAVGTLGRAGPASTGHATAAASLKEIRARRNPPGPSATSAVKRSQAAVRRAFLPLTVQPA
jgi:hypothetical protein